MSGKLDFNNEIELIGDVISQFNNLEWIVDSIIVTFIQPQASAKEFVSKHLIHNSILSFGAKIKLLFAIINFLELEKIDKDKLHRLLALRNAVAHSDLIGDYEIRSSGSNDNRKHEEYFVVDQMRSDGSVKTIRKNEVYKEFVTLFVPMQVHLGRLLDSVNANCIPGLSGNFGRFR